MLGQNGCQKRTPRGQLCGKILVVLKNKTPNHICHLCSEINLNHNVLTYLGPKRTSESASSCPSMYVKLISLPPPGVPPPHTWGDDVCALFSFRMKRGETIHLHLGKNTNPSQPIGGTIVREAPEHICSALTIVKRGSGAFAR